MRTLVCWVPCIVAFFMLFFRTTEKVFLNVYIPVLLLLPQQFYALTSGFPKLNFSETTIIPITLAFFWKNTLRWKLSFTDLLMFNFILWKFIAEYVNGDLHYAINKLASTLCDNVAPYILGKGLIHSKNMDELLAKRIVFLMFVNVLISFFEAIFAKNLHVDIISFLFFPGNYSMPLQRFGFTRIVGPFSEAIFFGMGIALAILLNYWMCKNKLWKPNFKYVAFTNIKKGTIITIVLVIGLILNLSRGPMISCILGYLFIGASFSKKPLLSLVMRSSVAFAALLMLYSTYSSYTDVSTNAISTDTEYNVAYRWELQKVYSDYAWERPWFGWGTLVPPIKEQYSSLDNAYLFIFLSYGLIALITIISIILWVMFRLLLRSIKIHRRNNLESSLDLTLMGSLGTLAFCFIIVFMASQPEVLFFLIVGWGEGLLTMKPTVKRKETDLVRMQES